MGSHDVRNGVRPPTMVIYTPLIIILIVWLEVVLVMHPASAQEEESKIQWALRGYVKDLVSVQRLNDETYVDNLVHNRLNLSVTFSSSLSAYVEVRNRIFTGDLVKTIPGYSTLIDVNDDYFDLSATVLDRKAWVIHSMIDRAYVEWYYKQWEVRAGRQRINWGKNLVWNPNDWFNAYSFFDFDYEERPGSDAIRIRRYTGFASSLEVAASVHEDFDQMVMAGLWQINRWNYDIQFLAGKVREDIAFGVGWAGNLSDASFKGELSYFTPYTSSIQNAAFSASLSTDYSFESSLYLHGSLLFNSDGSNDPPVTGLLTASSERLTARSLLPYRYSLFEQTSYQIHPLLTAGAAFMFFPSDHALFINPTLTWSVCPNWDIDIVGQIFLDEFEEEYQAVAKLLFFRAKCSF